MLHSVDRCSVDGAAIGQVCHSFRTAGTETRMSPWVKSYSRAWCYEADVTHITLWSICCSSCGDGGRGIGWRRRVDVIVVVAVVVWRELECLGVSARTVADRSERDCSLEYGSLSYRSMHVLMLASFCRLRFFLGRQISTTWTVIASRRDRRRLNSTQHHFLTAVLATFFKTRHCLQPFRYVIFRSCKFSAPLIHDIQTFNQMPGLCL